MTEGFTGGEQGTSATFLPEEARVMRNLIGELIELLRDDAPDPSARAPEDSFTAIVGHLGSTEPPEDDVLQRLLPSAYVDDDEAAGDFRRFTEMGLRDGKVASAEVVLETLGDPEYADRLSVSLDRNQAEAWLRTLTDLRLALGTRLGVEQDDEEQWAALPENDQRRQVYGVYVWLGFLQESLVAAL